jgi:hypothetical protein
MAGLYQTWLGMESLCFGGLVALLRSRDVDPTGFHGPGVSVTSVGGHGSAFTVRLPAA